MRRRRRPPTSIFLFSAGKPTAQPNRPTQHRGRATYTTPGSSGLQTAVHHAASSTAAADNNCSKPSRRKLQQLTPGAKHWCDVWERRQLRRTRDLYRLPIWRTKRRLSARFDDIFV